LFTHLLDAWLVFLSAAFCVLIVRIGWFSSRGELLLPQDWSPAERFWGRLAASGLGLAALVCGLTAVYVAMRVPWVENFPALLANPPKVVAGREPAHISTASYLFAMPVALGVCAAMLTDPWGSGVITFRGPRALALRVLPAIGLAVCGMSLWRSVEALSAALP
jgi:hypothetical protein